MTTIPERLMIGDTGRTLSREDAARAGEELRLQLWYEEPGELGPRRVFPYYDDTGVSFYGAAAEQLPRMTRRRLESLGWTDERLEKLAAETIGPRAKGIPALRSELAETVEMQERRRALFDLVCRLSYG